MTKIILQSNLWTVCATSTEIQEKNSNGLVIVMMEYNAPSGSWLKLHRQVSQHSSVPLEGDPKR